MTVGIRSASTCAVEGECWYEEPCALIAQARFLRDLDCPQKGIIGKMTPTIIK